MIVSYITLFAIALYITPAIATVDIFMEYSFSKRFNKEGVLEDILACTHWAYDRNKAEALLTDPHFTRSYSPQEQWNITAKKGISFHHPHTQLPKHIVLEEAVAVSRLEQALPLWTLETDHLILYPEQERCDTDSKIVLTMKNGSTIHAQGLQATFTGSILELKHEVRSLYYVHPPALTSFACTRNKNLLEPHHGKF